MGANYQVMPTDYQCDMAVANRAFTFAWSKFSNMMGGGHILYVETSTDPVLCALDKKCGIDALQVTDSNEVRTLAVRLQWTKKYGQRWAPFNAWTFRYERYNGHRTEVEKLQRLLEDHRKPAPMLIGPRVTLHVYVADEARIFLSAGAVSTINITEYICELEKLNAIPRYKRLAEVRDSDLAWIIPNQQNADMLVIPWARFQKNYEQIFGKSPKTSFQCEQLADIRHSTFGELV